jgi:glycyl-tRNA synthetase beta chain
MAERAARLAKADLVTGMVGEFPELQGLMGGYYARAQGEAAEVADAVRDHYKPVGQGDDVPTAPVTIAVSLADKIDSLAQFFAEDMKPTGSKDPFALRRSALAILQIIQENRLRVKMLGVFSRQINLRQPRVADPISDQIVTFLIERLKVQQREAGIRHDLIDAVFALGGEDDLVRLLARVHALQAFIDTEDGANLLAGYKRAANILKKENYSFSIRSDDDYDREPAEIALAEAIDIATPGATAAIESEDFEAAMAVLATLRAPIDTFFEEVIVMDPDKAKSAARLALLARVRDAVHAVADFSKIEG